MAVKKNGDTILELNNLFAKMYEDRVKGIHGTILTKEIIPCSPSNTVRSSNSLTKRICGSSPQRSSLSKVKGALVRARRSGVPVMDRDR